MLTALYSCLSESLFLFNKCIILLVFIDILHFFIIYDTVSESCYISLFLSCQKIIFLCSFSFDFMINVYTFVLLVRTISIKNNTLFFVQLFATFVSKYVLFLSCFCPFLVSELPYFCPTFAVFLSSCKTYTTPPYINYLRILWMLSHRSPIRFIFGCIVGVIYVNINCMNALPPFYFYITPSHTREIIFLFSLDHTPAPLNDKTFTRFNRGIKQLKRSGLLFRFYSCSCPSKHWIWAPTFNI